MSIDIERLESQLMQMSAQGAPGRDFCRSISELARTGRFDQLRDVLPPIVYDELWNRYQLNPAAFIACWRMLAIEMQHGFIQHARQRLTSLTRIQRFGEEAAAALPIQYGGSMKPENAAALLHQADVDGGLIGGASLNAAQFLAIVRAGV